MSRREHYNLNTQYFHLPAPGGSTNATTMNTEDDFPHFVDGDVLVITTASRRYKLHSTVLRRCSPTFATLLDEDAAVTLSKNARKKGVTTRYRLHLIVNENAGVRQGGVESPSHVLRRIPLDESGGAAGEFPDLLGDANENGRVVEQFVLVSLLCHIIPV